jgi:hypothetical protein
MSLELRRHVDVDLSHGGDLLYMSLYRLIPKVNNETPSRRAIVVRHATTGRHVQRHRPRDFRR